MAYPTTSPQPSRLTRFSNNLQTWVRNLLRQTFRPGDFEALFIILGMLLFPIGAMHQAGWTGDLLILIPVTIFGLLVSHMLARSGFSEGYALMLTLLYGFATIITVHLVALPGDFSVTGRMNDLTERLRLWTQDISTGTPGTENLVFAMFLSVLFWFLAHNSIWHVIRLDRVWRAIIPVGFLLVVNNGFYTGDKNLDIYVIGFLFFALLLVAHNNTRTRVYEWHKAGLRFSNKAHRGFIRMGAVVAIVVLLISQALPVGNGEDNWEKFEAFLSSGPVNTISDLWSKLFSSLEGQGVATTDYYGGDRLNLTGAIQLGDDPIMQIKLAERLAETERLYWRATIFDTYDGRGWSHRRSVRAFKESEGMEFNVGTYASRRSITQNITMFIGASPLVYAAPEWQAFEDVVVEAELNCVNGSTSCVNQQQQADVAIVNATEPLRKDESYRAISSISVATADELRVAGTDYPEWVTVTYLQGGDSIAPNVRDLTEQIIAASGATNNYDRAKAIEQWLRANITYNESIPAPDYNQDLVEWFLFDIQQGYYTYYATSMVMMLRSQGIPARMSAGFAQGEYNAQRGTYLVRENDAHTWVEAYFPGYGWINFEPTADEAPVSRSGDPDFSESFPDFAPEPSPTPTIPPISPTPPTQEPFAPTATASVTPTPTQNPVEQASGITATPEFNASPTPDATATTEAEIAPVLADASNDDDSNILETLLIALLSLIVTIAILTGGVLFAIWWIEHRGLGGLNPVQKAYARLGIYGRWIGVPLSNRQTPNERKTVLTSEVPDGAEPIDVITELYSQDRFGRTLSENARSDYDLAAQEAWGDARFAFLRRKFGRRNR